MTKRYKYGVTPKNNKKKTKNKQERKITSTQQKLSKKRMIATPSKSKIT